MHKFRALFACIFSVWFTSCITEPKQIPDVPIVNTTNRVGILCEGNYMWGNARFDVYSVDSNKLYPNVFESENKKPIGDVLQSGYFDGSSIWLTVNNSGKILKLNSNTYKQINSRGSLRSPRYLLPAGKYIFCSDIQANAISVLDSTSLQTIKEIGVYPKQTSSRFGWTEQMILWQNKVTVACYDGKILMIHPLNLDTTQIASDSGSQNMVVDGYNRLWILASVNGVSSLSCFGENLKLEKKISFPKNYSLSRLAISPEKDQLYFIGQNQVHSLSIESTVYSDRITVFDKAKNCYGIGIDPRNGWLYVADAQDYVSNGTVYVVNRNGKIINTLTTGVIPADFIFF